MTPAEFMHAMMLGARDAIREGAPIHPQGAAAHAANETGYGRSGLSRPPNHNLFGVKATGVHTPFWDGASVVMPTWEVYDGKRVEVDAAFRRYATYGDAFGDYGDIIRRVYPRAAQARTDLAFLHGLFIAGPRRWATDPAAFDKAARIIATHAELLYEPQAPLEVPGGATVVVLHDLPFAARWAALTRREAILRGEYAWRFRARENGGRLDVRKL